MATVFFLGIAIAVATTLFLMSSTYNNLYQQQLQVREDRLREFIVLADGRAYNMSGKFTVMNLLVKNTGTVTAHVVSAYLNDQLVANDLSVWISPTSTGWTGNITLTGGMEVHVNDRVIVSTDRGTISTAIVQWSWFVGPTYKGGGITPYQIQVIALNPTPPERKGSTQFTLFQRQYFIYVIEQRLLSPVEYGTPSIAPARFQSNPNATTYDPQGSVGVQAGIPYAIWMEEFQLEPSKGGGGGNYSIKSIRWAHYNITRDSQLHPVNATIPIGWPTWTYTVSVVLAPSDYVFVNPPEWTIIFEGTPTGIVGTPYQFGGSVSFTGGENNENLINVDLTLSVDQPNSRYDVTNKFPAGAGNIKVIHFDLLLNGIAPEQYYWIVRFKEAGVYNLTVTATGEGQVSGTDYSSTASWTVTVT